MSRIVSGINELFNVPHDSLGELIVREARLQQESGNPVRRIDLWMLIHDWIVGRSYVAEPDRNIFGMPRTGCAVSYAGHAMKKEGEVAQVAFAVAAAQSVYEQARAGHGNGAGAMPLHILLGAAAVGGISPAHIIYMADDFTRCAQNICTALEECE